MRTRLKSFTRNKCIAPLAVAMLLLIYLVGCGGVTEKRPDNTSSNHAPTTPAEFLFLSLPASDRIAAFQIDPQTGALTQVAGSPFPASGKRPSGLAAHPSGPFLYGVASPIIPNDAGTGIVSGYQIAANGALTPLNSQATSGMEPFALSIDPSGQYLYTAAALSIIPDGYVIDAITGLLTPRANAPTDYQNRFGAGGVLVLNGFVYESCNGGIAIFKMDASGALEGQTRFFDPGSGVGPMVLGAGNKFMFGVTGRGDFRPPPDVYPEADIFSASINNDGSLSMAGTPFKLAASLASSGTFLFALDLQGVWAFTIDPNTGAFSLVPGSPLTMSNEGGSLQVDRSGKFLYVATNNSSTNTSMITIFSINSSTGALEPAGGSLPLAESVGGVATSTRNSQ